MVCRGMGTPILSFSLLTAAAFGAGFQDEEKKVDAGKQRRDKLIATYLEHAASYKIELGQKAVALSLEAKPVLSWLNPARVATPRLQHGAVFVWTHQLR